MAKTQFLLIPTRRLAGIEDPLVGTAALPNYWRVAWAARGWVFQRAQKELPRDAIGMAINELLHNGHVGYWCAPEARGRGVATRALRLLCRHALDDLRLDRLELVTDPDNRASQRVAEKVGFRREGVLRSHLLHPDGRRRDSVMFSLLPGELL